ncbi:MAG: hypothetical protein KGQ40_03610 [Rhodospirillales bacterium]|nr:hypothetical protein [Rhodospirillales bacterium]
MSAWDCVESVGRLRYGCEAGAGAVAPRARRSTRLASSGESISSLPNQAMNWSGRTSTKPALYRAASPPPGSATMASGKVSA